LPLPTAVVDPSMRRFSVAAVALMLASFGGSALADRPARHVEEVLGTWRMGGFASYYGPGFNGRKMANGQRFDQMAPTAASPWLPFGTRVRVKARNGRSEIVTITDRGPFVRGRAIDLSLGTARRLGIERQGVAPVELEVLG
jgi:rare lipoprotein A (peptidoglycan hydrolase)